MYQQNKNKFILFYAIATVLLFSNYTCIAMNGPQNPNPDPAAQQQVPVPQIPKEEHPVKSNNIDLMRAGYEQTLIDLDAAQQAKSKLEKDLAQEKKEKEDKEKEVKHFLEHPPLNIGKAEIITLDPAVNKALKEKHEAQAKYYESKHGWPKEVSNAADHAFWPILKEQGSHFLTELRKRKYPTKMERQNDKIMKLKKRGEQRSLDINDIDLATKLIVLEQNKATQEASELLSDAQILGQHLQNTLGLFTGASADEKKKLEASTTSIIEINEHQVKQFHAKTFAKKAPASEEKVHAQRLIKDVLERPELERQRKLAKKAAKEKEEEEKERKRKLQQSLNQNNED